MSNGEEDPLSQELEDEVQSRLSGFREESSQFETSDLVQGYTGQSYRSTSSGARPPIGSNDGLGSLDSRANPRFFEETRTFQETIDSAPRSSSHTNVEPEAKTDPQDVVSVAAEVLLALSPDEYAQVVAIAASHRAPANSNTNLETPTKRNVSFEQHPSSVIASTSSTVSPITTSTGVRSTGQAVAIQPYQGDGALVPGHSSGLPPRGEEKKEDNSRFPKDDPFGTRRPPTCLLCKQLGHFTAKCPNWCKKCQAVHRPEDCVRIPVMTSQLVTEIGIANMS